MSQGENSSNQDRKSGAGDFRADPTGRMNEDVRSAPQIAVITAMGLVAMAASVALYTEGHASGLSAFFYGLFGFIFLVLIHGLLRHYKHTLELSPRVDRIEDDVDRLQSDFDSYGDLSDRFHQLDELTKQVEELQGRLSHGGGSRDVTYSGEAVSDEAVLQEVAELEQEIRDIRADIEASSRGQRQQFGSEMQVLQTLIKQVAEQYGGPPSRPGFDSGPSRSTGYGGQQGGVPVPSNYGFNEQGTSNFGLETLSQDGGTLGGGTLSTSLGSMTESDLATGFGQLGEPAGSDSTEHEEVPAPAADQETFAFSDVEETAADQAFAEAEPDMLDVVRDSIETNRVELFLQPIVGLPDRDVRYYEALTRLRDRDGQLMLPDIYIDVAEKSGMMPFIDNIMLFRTVQVIRRLSEKDSPRGVFCNISHFSLLDPEFFPEFIEFMGENQHLSDYLFFEFSQPMIRSAGAEELAGLSALAKLGFKFSMDQVTDLNLDFRALGEKSFRFMKLDVRIFLHGMADSGARIHAADMASYMKRNGLELIIEKVEDERSVASLEDYEVPLAQGYLFSEPRPVRPEIFNAAA